MPGFSVRFRRLHYPTDRLQICSGRQCPLRPRDGGWSPARSGAKWETITSAGIGQPEPRTDGSYEGGHVAAITDLIEAVETNRETKCSARDCTAIVEMIAAVFESHRVGKPVELPLKTRVNPLTLLA